MKKLVSSILFAFMVAWGISGVRTAAAAGLPAPSAQAQAPEPVTAPTQANSTKPAPAAASAHSEKFPRLVVRIVVGGLPYDWLGKFRKHLSGEGVFVNFWRNGTVFEAANYNFMQTLPAAGLATLATGVNPDIHGVIANSWMDYVTGNRVWLIDDDACSGIGSEPGTEKYSPHHIVMPTLGDKLLAESPRSKVISIASEPVSAIVSGGQNGTAYWMDHTRASWVTSTHYMTALPDWLVRYNETRPANFHLQYGWPLARPSGLYVNTSNTIFPGGKGIRIDFTKSETVNYPAMLETPIGNTLVAQMAALVTKEEKLGTDDYVDILNVCLDSARRVGQTYGNNSMEVEDMLYRLDLDLATMVREIEKEVGKDNVIFVLTSDCGASDSYNAGPAPRDRFVVNQFKTLLNSFLGVQFGSGDWVLDYIDRQLYLNHNLIYKKGLNMVDVQNRAAAFALQFRGVSHVLTSTAMNSGYFGSGYGLYMQSSFYPRRAGDLMLNLMPGWIEERDGIRSLSGSYYDYDTHVPLIFYGAGVRAQRVPELVDMTWVAPTIARMIGIGKPIGSDGKMLPGLT